MALALVACNDKAQRRLPPPVDDAGLSILQSDPALKRKPVDVLKAFEQLDWSVGRLSPPLQLLEYTRDPSHPPFCHDGGLLLDELHRRVDADTASNCTARRSAETQELEVQCRIEIEGECPHLYRTTLWAELDREVENKYRLLAVAWLQETVCRGPHKGKRANVDPEFVPHVRIGKSFKSLLDQCRQSGTQPP